MTHVSESRKWRVSMAAGPTMDVRFTRRFAAMRFFRVPREGGDLRVVQPEAERRRTRSKRLHERSTALACLSRTDTPGYT